MSRLLTGVLIVMFVLVTSFIAGTVSALYQSTSGPAAASFTKCSTANNFTTCQDVGKSSFLSQVFSASILPFGASDGLGGFLSVVWLLVMGLLLVAAVLLIVTSFVPTLSE